VIAKTSLHATLQPNQFLQLQYPLFARISELLLYSMDRLLDLLFS
tara:strand:- start:93212 stop:93346 length:135 start_codon:yes stop_codon:yes gene_type:complete